LAFYDAVIDVDGIAPSFDVILSGGFTSHGCHSLIQTTITLASLFLVEFMRIESIPHSRLVRLSIGISAHSQHSLDSIAVGA
jgi:hypothetical protein